MPKILICSEDYGAAAHAAAICKILSEIPDTRIKFICNDVKADESYFDLPSSVELFHARKMYELQSLRTNVTSILASFKPDIVMIGLFNDESGIDFSLSKISLKLGMKTLLIADDIGFSSWDQENARPIVLAVNPFVLKKAQEQKFESYLLGAAKYWTPLKTLKLSKTTINLKLKKLGFFAQPYFIPNYISTFEQICHCLHERTKIKQSEFELVIRPHPSNSPALEERRIAKLYELPITLLNDNSQYWSSIGLIDTAISISSTSLLDWLAVNANCAQKVKKPSYILMDETYNWHKERSSIPWSIEEDITKVVRTYDELQLCFSDDPEYISSSFIIDNIIGNELSGISVLKTLCY